MPAFYRLSTLIDALAAGSRDATGISLTNLSDQSKSDIQAAPAFFQQAQIITAYQVGADILVGGALVAAGQATDEPFQAGGLVWVSQTQDGTWLIHGSVK